MSPIKPKNKAAGMMKSRKSVSNYDASTWASSVQAKMVTDAHLSGLPNLNTGSVTKAAYPNYVGTTPGVIPSRYT